MKKILLITLVLVVTVATGIFAPPSYRSTSDNILAEVVVWSGTGTPRGAGVYYFVIKNNGTLVGYYGRSRSSSEHSRSSNFLMLIQRRKRVILNEEEFSHISQLVERIVEINTHLDGWLGQEMSFTSTTAMFLHNGNVHEHGSVRSGSLRELNRMLFELTYISRRWYVAN